MTPDATAFHADGDRWMPAGPLTMDSAAGLLAASTAAALPAHGVVDLQGVDAVDSAGVALLLAWKRRADAEGKPMVFAHLPASLGSLAQLYGVEDLLTVEPT